MFDAAKIQNKKPVVKRSMGTDTREENKVLKIRLLKRMSLDIDTI